MRALPDPSVLASRRLWVGDVQVDVLLREIRGRAGAGPARRLTPKAIGVLQELAAHAGEVVTRDQLLAAVWPDTLPTDDVLTQAITQLRKAFRQAGGPEECIQTIAKTGYRLVPEVRPEPNAGSEPADRQDSAAPRADAAPTTPDPAPAATRVPSRRLLWMLAGSAALLVIVVLGFAWQRDTPPPRTSQAPATPVSPPPFQLITSAPGGEFAPSLSPDGRWVAYVATPPGEEGRGSWCRPPGSRRHAR